MITEFNTKPSNKKLKSFSQTMALLLPVFIILFGLFKMDFSSTETLSNGFRPFLVWATGFFLYFLFCRFVFLKALLPFYFFWMGLSLVLGAIVSPIILSVFYFLIVTPVGLISRASGKKWLMVDGSADSYWQTLRPQRPEDVKNQF